MKTNEFQDVLDVQALVEEVQLPYLLDYSDLM